MSDAGSARSIEAKRLQLNLKVLQRHDPSIVEIIDSTSYVVLYKYVPAPAPSDADSQDSSGGMQWVKTSIEGSMFIYRRSQPPLYGFFILNRHGVENFSHYLEDEAALELTPEYIIVQGDDEQIKGIWVFEEEHRERLGQKMLELSRASKRRNAAVKSSGNTPTSLAVGNAIDSPGSASSSKPLPSGQSISLDMLFGNPSSAPTDNNQQGHNGNGNQIDLWAQQQQQNDSLEPQANANSGDKQGLSLLDSLFAEMSGNPPSNARAPQQQMRPDAASADEDALRNLLGLGPVTKPSPQPYQSQPSPRSIPQPSPSLQQHPLYQSHGPTHQQQPQPILEPLAPRPQKLAQFDSVEYEPPVQQHMQQQQQHMPRPQIMDQYSQNTRYQSHLPAHPPPQPHFQQHPAPPPQQQQQYHQQPVPYQQPFVSAPLMPSVILNKNKPSPTTQQRTVPPQQVSVRQQEQQPSMPSSGFPAPYGNAPQPMNSVPQYSPSHANLQKQISPPILRVKSPLRQSQTYGYASSENTNSETRFGAQSIPPPPVPPVESRPIHQQQQQQPAQRRNSGDNNSNSRIPPQQQQSFSPRGSPSDTRNETTSMSPSAQAMEVLNDALKTTSLYNPIPVEQQGQYIQAPIPVDRYTFKQHLHACVQDERFVEAVYQRYLHHLAGR